MLKHLQPTSTKARESFYKVRLKIIVFYFIFVKLLSDDDKYTSLGGNVSKKDDCIVTFLHVVDLDPKRNDPVVNGCNTRDFF